MAENILQTQKGALPDFLIKELINQGHIIDADPSAISPASLDLTITNEAYLVEGAILNTPRNQKRVRDLLPFLNPTPHNFDVPFAKDAQYLIRLKEKLALPPEVYAFANPKSTSARNWLHVEVLSDFSCRFDACATESYQGELWCFLYPKLAPTLIEPGMSFSQLRFFTADTRIKDYQTICQELDRHGLLFSHCGKRFRSQELVNLDKSGVLPLTACILGEYAGWEFTPTNKVLDLRRKDLDPLDFARPLEIRNGRVQIFKDRLYLISTLERIRVPPDWSCELLPNDWRFGDFTAHLAGFFDPGWGYGPDGEGCGRHATLEVVPHKNNILQNNQFICSATFERMIARPRCHYESNDTHNYTKQDSGYWSLLSKNFRKSAT